MNAVARVGPVAISVDASWGAYSGGVFNGACGTTIDHAVVLVGCVREESAERHRDKETRDVFWRRGAHCSTRCRTLLVQWLRWLHRAFVVHGQVGVSVRVRRVRRVLCGGVGWSGVCYYVGCVAKACGGKL